MLDLSQWAEFGLSALIIGALLGIMVFLFKTAMNLIKTIHSEHKEERVEWREETTKREIRYEADSEKRDLRYEASMREFSQAIKDLRDNFQRH